MQNNEQLRKEVEKRVQRMRDAEKEKDTLLAQTIYLGTLGMLFVLPVVAGAYFGLWLDEKSAQYSAMWTVSLTLIGILIGAVNVYFFIRYK